MRKINWKLGLVLLIGVVVLPIRLHTLHIFQVRRTATSSLALADKARDEGQIDKELEYLNRYLIQRPEAKPVLARFGLALNRRARTIEQQREAFATLERILRRDPSQDE